MSLKKSVWAILAIFIAFNITSCKKEEEDETYLVFSGSLDFSLQKFVKAGDVLKLVPKGLKIYDDETTYGYYWKVDPTQTALDTTKTESDPRTVLGEFVYEIPDTLCTLKFTVVVFGTDYYTTSVYHSTTILDEEKSLTGLDFSACDGVFIDSRDGKEYPYSTIGDLDWFSKNLAYNGVGVPYENCDVTCNVFGHFYNWKEAKEACPEGWRLPTEEDWINLAKAYISNKEFSPLGTFPGISGHLASDETVLNGEDESLWEYWPAVKYANDDSMNVLPFGYCVTGENTYSFDGFSDYAVLWTGTSYSDEQAVYRYIFESSPDVYAAVSDKESFLANVRCVRDATPSEPETEKETE